MTKMFENNNKSGKLSLRMALAAPLLSGLLLAGCNQSEPSAPTPVETTPEVPVETNSDATQFDGTTSQVEKLDTPLSAYKVEFTLLSEVGTGSTEYNDTSPPMPGIVGSLSFYHLSDAQYRVVVVGHTEYGASFGTPTEETQVSVVGTPAGSAVYVNEALVLETPIADVLKGVTLGKGFNNRFWTGEVSAFEVCEISETAALGDLSSAVCL